MRNDNPGRHGKDCGDEDCGEGLRNRFFAGKTVGVELFAVEQRYLIGRRRLLNRAIAGHGIAYGFALKRGGAAGAPLEIGRGVALDCHGAEIVNDSCVDLQPAGAVMLEEKSAGCFSIASSDAYTAGTWLLSVHYAERDQGRVLQDAGCGCKSEEFSFLCETLVFSLRRLRNDECPCDEDDCRPGTSIDDGTGLPRQRECAAAETVPGCGPFQRKRCEWHGLYFDPNAGVPLACVKIAADPNDRCNPQRFDSVVDDRAPRRYVNIRRLYDLIRGCDLTRIEDISWKSWHRQATQVPWNDFKARFAQQPIDTTPPPDKREGLTEFVVRFSRPVKTATLTPDAFVFRGITREPGTAWGDSRRVPVVRIDTQRNEQHPPKCGGWPDGTTNQARLIIKWGWYDDEVSDGATDSWFKDENGMPMEIEIRGDLILDCNGVAVDASPRGLGAASVPSGNGTPGGSFVSAFRVAQKA